MFEILGYLENRTLGFVINIFRLRTIHWKFWPPVYTTALTLLAATCNVFYIYRNIFLYPRATSHSFSYIIHLSVHQSLYFMHWKSFASNVLNCVWKSGIDIFIHFLQVCLFLWIDLKTLNQVYTRLKFLKLSK